MDEAADDTRARVATALAADHNLALSPDVDSPFTSELDVVHRLMPYHAFQFSHDDLDVLSEYVMSGSWAPQSQLQREVQETRFAIACHARLDSLKTRFWRARIHEGYFEAPTDASLVLAQGVLDADRASNQALTTELRAARATLDRARLPRAQYQPQSSSTGYGAHYRPYHPPGQPAPPPLMSASQHPHTSFNSPIPVQLPVRLLPALTQLGIVPVPLSRVPPPDRPQPACVSLGTIGGGMALSLTINLSLLQPSQMSGLAVLLNSLVSSGQNGIVMENRPLQTNPLDPLSMSLDERTWTSESMSNT